MHIDTNTDQPLNVTKRVDIDKFSKLLTKQNIK